MHIKEAVQLKSIIDNLIIDYFENQKNKYGYQPYQEKKGTFYLLMEPDPARPTSYKGWQETVIKTGKIIETRTLPSGLIVEKRKEIAYCKDKELYCVANQPGNSKTRFHVEYK